MNKLIMFFPLVAVLPVGCASTPVPADKVASAESSIRAAQEVNAPASPASALHLKLAQDQFNLAKKLIDDGDNLRAEYVLVRAESDAELAVSLARETTTKEQAAQALERVRGLRTQQQQTMSVDGKKGV